MAKSAAAPHAVVELVPLSRIVESPTNPRKTFTELEDLAADIKQRGVLQPVLLRPAAGDGMNRNLFELVFGARRFRAAQLAGLEAIPAMVREISATEALEIQIVENSARQDVHPMEEAEGYEALRAADGAKYSVEEIAAKVGRSASYVYGRMKLLALCKEGRKAFYDGLLTASSAVLVARVPDQEVQRKILAELGRFYRDDEAWSTGQVSRVVQQHLLRLADAPFARDAEDLVPGVGSCKACPKRSGAQPQLFADVDKRDELCTDPACFRAKAEAAWARHRAAAAAKGLKVLEGKAAEKACEYGSEYVRLDRYCDRDPKRRTWKQLIGKAAKDQIVLARDVRGEVHELVPKKETGKLLKAAGHDFKSGETAGRLRSGSKEGKAAAAKERESRELDAAIDRRVVEAIVARFETGELPHDLWRLAAKMVLDYAEFSLDRRLGEDWNRSGKADEKLITGLTEDQARGFVLETLFERAIYDTGWSPPQEKGVREELLGWAGIDRKAIAAEVKAERAAKAEAAPPAAEKKSGGKRGRR